MNKLIIGLCLILSACSGGSGGGGPTPQSTNGVFLDSPVGGVYFRSDTHSGMTDDQGRYQCSGSEEVQFYLKGDNGKEVSLGSSSCRSTTSPIDLATQGSLNYQTPLLDLSVSQQSHTIGLLRLLQSMDSDQNPSNGITISSADVSILANQLESQSTLNVALEQMFKSNEGYDTKLSSIISLMGKSVVSESSAIAHFNSSRGSDEPCEEESCEQPPVVDPPTNPVTEKECYQGVTYASSVFGMGGISYGSNYPINAETGELKPNAGFSEKVYTLIVIPTSGNAEFYRRSHSSGSFYKFPVNMTVIESSGVVQLRGVGFTDGAQTLTLGARVDSGGIMTRLGTEQTFGSFSSAFDRTFNKVDCYPPTTYTDLDQSN